MLGGTVAKRRFSDHLLDLERGVPLLELLVLKGERRRRAAGADQRVLIDDTAAGAAAVICPACTRRSSSCLTTRHARAADIAVFAVRVASTASVVKTSA